MSEKKKEEKKRKGRYSYLNDFKLNEQNEYEYQGAVYALQLDEKEKSELFRKTLLMLSAVALLIILCGIIPFEGMMNSFYIIIPYVFEIGFGAFLINAVYTIYKNEELREYVYKKSAGRIGVYGPGLLGNSIIRLVGSLVFLLLKGSTRPLYGILYFLITVVLIFLEIRSVQKVMNLKYRTVKQKSADIQDNESAN